MHTPTPTPTTTPIRSTPRPDLGRADGAEPHGRSATFSGVERTERSSADRGRAFTVRVGLASALLALGLAGAPAAIAASYEDTPPQGSTPGLADGWYAPDTDGHLPGTVTAGALTSTPTPGGYAAGRPDGWYEPGTSDAQVAGVSLTRTTEAPLRLGYAAGQPDGWYEPGASDMLVAGVALTHATAATVPANVR